MPLYEYICNECGRVFEKIVSFTEAKKNPACPDCQSQHTQKKISKVASTGGSKGSDGNCGSSGRFS
jgi:putative FmdB family regulatory protein